ncbi:MaoC family dehydratase [Nocardia africana]
MPLPIIPRIGDSVPPFRVDEVDADKIRIMALVLQDPNPIHFDLEAVRAAGLGDRFVNQGGVTMAYIVNMLTRWTGSRAAVRTLDCRFHANVFAGETVEAGGEVIAVRQEGADTLVDCDVWVRRCSATGYEDDPVVGGTATVALRTE